MTERLRTAKINGVKGVRGDVHCAVSGIPPNECRRPAVIFGQWAIRKSLHTEAINTFSVIHIHTGYATSVELTQDKARSLVAALFPVPTFKSMRAECVRGQMLKLYLAWMKEQKEQNATTE